MKHVKRLLVAAGMIGIFGVAILIVRTERGLTRGERLIGRGQWQAARTALGRYLWLHPRSDQARMLMAEALVKDDRLAEANTAREAIDFLAAIEDRSPLGAEARLREARLVFFLQFQPARAERLFHRAIELNPRSFEARYMLWKLLDMTGKSLLAESLVWETYDMAPESERPRILREWYLSQFFPSRANPLFDLLSGFSSGATLRIENPEFNRILRYMESEPDAPVNHAAFARLYQNEGDHHEALKLLDKVIADPRALENAYCVSTVVHSLFELGDFEGAKRYFDQWPEPHDGYEYWKWRAMLADEVDHDYPRALAAYDRALSVWPGQADWRTQFRKANCLAKQGDKRYAADVRVVAKKVELLLEIDVHRDIRAALRDLDDPRQLDKVRDFYAGIGRNREAGEWQRVIERLDKRKGAEG